MKTTRDSLMITRTIASYRHAFFYTHTIHTNRLDLGETVPIFLTSGVPLMLPFLDPNFLKILSHFFRLIGW